MKPITPAEAASNKNLPDFVIQAFNQLITEKFNDGVAVIKQEEVIVRMQTLSQVMRQQIFDYGWLNVEGVYRKFGWRVEFDKPGYNETYPATFTFRSK